MFPTTPFPASMYSTSSYYWNPSTYSWVPKPIPTTPYYPNRASFPQWNAAPFYAPVPSIPHYSYSIPTTGYPMDPYASLNQGSYYNYVNYYSPNRVPSNIPNYYPAQFPGSMPMPPPTAPMTAAPSNPAPPAPKVKTGVPKIKPESPPKCSNCQTTDPSKLRNAGSKDNIMCHKCFIYRKINKKDRPTSKTVKKEVKKEMKRIKTE